MIAKDAGKKKRVIQPTLNDFFKRQRLTVSKQEGSSSMISSEIRDESDMLSPKSDERQSPSTSLASQQEETLEHRMDEKMNKNKPEEPLRLGTSLSSLNQAPDCCAPLPALSPRPGHTILFRPHICADKPPRPYPDTYRDSWDRSHVRMPCSKESLYPVKNVDTKLRSRWELIRTSLLRPITSSYDLQEAILSYNAHYAKRWNFRTLHLYFLEAIPLLKSQQEHTITLTQEQVASLLANAFLCTFPRRNGVRSSSDHEFGNYPEINFSRLFQGNHQESSKKIEKLKCILHYFNRITERPSFGTISYKRQVLRPDETPKWHSCTSSLCHLRVLSDGAIEMDAPGFLQVDFANEFVGGGVLGEGCVQEEVRFAICPELVLSRLFTERLAENECLLITGAERFSNYTGYATTFRWAGNFIDRTPRDSWGRRHTEVVAIDAKPYMRYWEQFSPPNVKRDLEKAFCGFLSRGTEPQTLTAVATGKWGCGAFNGDRQLKSLIQIMAASAACRDVVYFTFGDKEHAKKLHSIHTLLKERDVTVGNLWQIINDYRKDISSLPSSSRGIFSYIRNVLEIKSDANDASDVTNSVDCDNRTSPILVDDSP